jgi:hypothetical protein
MMSVLFFGKEKSMGQVLWFRKANELYHVYRCAPSSQKGATFKLYKTCLTDAANTGKCPEKALHLTIVRRSGAYYAARLAGKTEEEAFDIAAAYQPVLLTVEYSNGPAS